MENNMTEYRMLELLKEIKNILTGKNKNNGYVDIAGASKYCSVSISTIRRNVKNNKLKASTNLGKLLFKKSDLEDWLNS